MVVLQKKQQMEICKSYHDIFPDWYDDYVKNVEDKENKPEKPKANDQKTIEELDELFKFKTR